MFCPNWGAPLNVQVTQQRRIMVITTLTLSGISFCEVLCVITGLTVRTRGAVGKFVVGIEGMFGLDIADHKTYAYPEDRMAKDFP